MTINNDDEDRMNARAYRRARMAESTEEQIPTALGVWCMIHGKYDCDEPWCWRCGSHLMDEHERCADQRCRASNGPDARIMVEATRNDWERYGPVGEPVPLELIEFFIGLRLQDKLRATISAAGGRDGTGPGDGMLSSPASSPLED